LLLRGEAASPREALITLEPGRSPGIWSGGGICGSWGRECGVAFSGDGATIEKTEEE
jgi:hypothetical protein